MLLRFSYLHIVGGLFFLLLLPRGGDCGMLHEPNRCDRGKNNTTAVTSSATTTTTTSSSINQQEQEQGGRQVEQPICQDTNSRCEMWAEEGECEGNAVYMLSNCPCSCNSCPIYIKNEWDDEPQMAMGPLKEEIEWNIQRTEEYMQRFKTYFSFSLRNCRNKHKGCSHWSLLGKVEKRNQEIDFNPKWC